MTVGELVIRMRTVGAKAAAADMGEAEAAMGGMGRTAKTVAGVAGIAGVAFGIRDVTKAAINFQAQQASLQNSLRNTGQYSKAAMGAITDAADHAATHGGFNPVESIAGMQNLIRAGDSVKKAIRDQTLVTDIARARQIPYATALRAVMMVEQGRTTGLARLGIVIQPVKTAEQQLADQYGHSRLKLEAYGKAHKLTSHEMSVLRLKLTEQHAALLAVAKAHDKAGSQATAMTTLWHRYGGEMGAFSRTAAGGASNFRNSIDLLAQRVGVILLPIVNAFIHALTNAANWLIHNQTAVKVLVGVMGALAVLWTVTKIINFARGLRELWAVQKLVTAAEVVWGVVTAALTGELTLAEVAIMGVAAATTVLEAIPIIAVIAGIIAIVILLVTHFKEVKKFAVDAFHWVLQAVKDVWNWIKAHWPLLLAILTGPFGLAVLWIVNHWKQIVSVATNVLNWFKGAWQTVKDILVAPFNWAWNNVLKPIWQWITNAGNDMIGWFKGVWQTLKDVIAAPFNWAWNNVIKPMVDAVHSFIGLVNTLNPFSGGGPGPTGQHAPMNTSPYGLGGGGHAKKGGRAFGGGVSSPGWFDVGEQGRERIWMPAGAYVQSNRDLMGGGQAPDTAVYEGQTVLVVDGYRIATALQRQQLKRKSLS